MAATQQDLDASNESYAVLKSRVKSVATELKERRVECRQLNMAVQEHTIIKERLETERDDFQMKNAKLEKCIDEKDEEITTLRTTVGEMRVDLKKKEKELSQKGTIGSKALEAYKKKAQASLANANARAATANQAREDAEIDATNARNEAESSLQKVKEAEAQRDAAMKESQEEIQVFLQKIDYLKLECEGLRSQLKESQAAVAMAEEEMRDASKSREEMLEEWTTKNEQLEKEKEICSSLEQDIAIERIKNKELEDEIFNLKEELENYASAAFMARQSEDKNQNNSESSKLVQSNDDKIESDGTIVMLQQELKVANEAIKDLKQALASTLENNANSPTIQNGPELPLQTSEYKTQPNRNSADETEATPLFFAFEKQAELNTARDEITRLAALLGDSESAKVEATDAMNEMRRKMEEAESRLRRYEKLAPASGRQKTATAMNSSFGRRGMTSMNNFYDSKNAMSTNNDSTVSLEYLKNIMLRYMNATSLNEKRALVPVIGAVLELTPDEQSLAMSNVERSANVTGVGVSLIENIQNKGINGLFG